MEVVYSNVLGFSQAGLDLPNAMVDSVLASTELDHLPSRDEEKANAPVNHRHSRLATKAEMSGDVLGKTRLLLGRTSRTYQALEFR